MRTSRFTTGLVAIVGLLAISCAGEDGTQSAASDTATPSVQRSATATGGKAGGAERGSTSARVIDTDFLPLAIEIKAGETVRWKQVGDQPHSVTAADESFDSSPDCGPIESDRCLSEGDTYSHVFEEPGTFTYYCRVHGLPDGSGMVGTVVVE